MNVKANITRRLVFKVTVLCLAAFFAGCVTAPKAGKTGKLNHIGLFWLKEPGNVADRQKLIAAAHRFARDIPEVQLLSVGQSVPKGSALLDTSFDICLIMQFDDQAAMDRYAKHPVHAQAAQEVFLPLSQKIQFYDFVAE
jgi:hypothetical protein